MAPHIAGRVPIDLRKIKTDDWAEANHRVRRLVQAACEGAPAGADVVVYVPDKGYPDCVAVETLRSCGDHLGSLTFEGDPFAIRQWIERYNQRGFSL